MGYELKGLAPKDAKIVRDNPNDSVYELTLKGLSAPAASKLEAQVSKPDVVEPPTVVTPDVKVEEPKVVLPAVVQPVSITPTTRIRASSNNSIGQYAPAKNSAKYSYKGKIGRMNRRTLEIMAANNTDFQILD